MIFVTVGNATQGFRRLLEAVDALGGTPILSGEEIVMQTGHNDDFHPKHSRIEPFLSMERFQARMGEARLIICHGGCGTLLQAIQLGKKPVAMPRLARYGEHVNDHQLQLIRALAEENRIVPAYEAADLPRAIDEARKNLLQPLPKSLMPDLIDQAIRELLTGKSA
jgi:UDP-N-acetylglucosamine transferase subunit ALG13